MAQYALQLFGVFQPGSAWRDKIFFAVLVCALLYLRGRLRLFSQGVIISIYQSTGSVGSLYDLQEFTHISNVIHSVPICPVLSVLVAM